jgi:hypothetical protein
VTAIETLILAASLTFPTAGPVAAYDAILDTYACEPYFTSCKAALPVCVVSSGRRGPVG